MSTEGLPDELRVLGLGAEAVAVYVCLLESGPLAPEDLAARLDCPAPAVGDTAFAIRPKKSNWRTASKYRVVYSQASLARPGFVTENIRPCVLAGEQARLLPEPLERGEETSWRAELPLDPTGTASALMARAGASNRFQLALHAARDNWC